MKKPRGRPRKNKVQDQSEGAPEIPPADYEHTHTLIFLTLVSLSDVDIQDAPGLAIFVSAADEANRAVETRGVSEIITSTLLRHTHTLTLALLSQRGR